MRADGRRGAVPVSRYGPTRGSPRRSRPGTRARPASVLERVGRGRRAPVPRGRRRRRSGTRRSPERRPCPRCVPSVCSSAAIIPPSTGPRGTATVLPTDATVTSSNTIPGAFSVRYTSPTFGVGGHDHRGRALAAGEPRPLRDGDGAVAVIEDVLAQVPDRSVVGLRVPVERDLLEATVEIGHVLGDEHGDLLAVPRHGPRAGQERRLGPKGLVVDVAEQKRGMEPADREQRVGDRRGVREGGPDEIHSLARRCATFTAVGAALRRRKSRGRSGGGLAVAVPSHALSASATARPRAVNEYRMGGNVGGPDERKMKRSDSQPAEPSGFQP